MSSGIFSLRCHPSILAKELNDSDQFPQSVEHTLFNENYVSGLFKSSVVGLSTYLAGCISIGTVVTQGINSTAIGFTVTTIFLNSVWHHYANAPGLLAQSAFNALSTDEDEALRLIQEGADIHYNFPDCSSGIPFLSLHPIARGFPRKSDSLLQEAVKHNRLRVISYLSQLGVDFNQSSSILGHAKQLATVITLVSCGSNVNLHNTVQYSPLYIQINQLKNTKDDDFKEQLAIINFLLEKGAQFQSGARFKEKSKCIRFLKEQNNPNLKKILEDLLWL